MKKTLLIRLMGVRQSYGISSNYDIRGTETAPSKSAVIGLLAAALGRKREDSIDDLFNLRMGVRIDSPGVMENEYQYAETYIKPKVYQYIIRRYYMSDAAYLVGLETDDDELLKKIIYALHYPTFQIYLGRKAYVISKNLYVGVREMNLEDALRNERSILSDYMKEYINPNAQIRILMDINEDEDAILMQNDVPISFVTNKREYCQRGIKQIYIPFDSISEIYSESDDEEDVLGDVDVDDTSLFNGNSEDTFDTMKNVKKTNKKFDPLKELEVVV